MKIYIFRHGSTEWNKEWRLQGESDIALDDDGINQAHEAGKALKRLNISFDRIFSSPLSRAYTTAKILSSYTNDNTEVKTDLRIKELAFGDFEGRVYDDLVSIENCPFKYFKTEPELYNKFAPDYYEEKQPESLTHLCERTKNFFEDVIEPMEKNLPDGNILLVAHGAVNKSILMHVLGEKDLKKFWGPGLQQNCHAAIISLNNGKYEVIEYNKEFK